MDPGSISLPLGNLLLSMACLCRLLSWVSPLPCLYCSQVTATHCFLSPQYWRSRSHASHSFGRWRWPVAQSVRGRPRRGLWRPLQDLLLAQDGRGDSARLPGQVLHHGAPRTGNQSCEGQFASQRVFKWWNSPNNEICAVNISGIQIFSPFS